LGKVCTSERCPSGCGERTTAILAVPEWEEYPPPPAVFIRATNKGLTAYAKWKSVEALDNKGTTKSEEALGLKDVTPTVLVRVRNTGLKPWLHTCIEV
jgi:hypothetical protein